jgi:hypothetical protein
MKNLFARLALAAATASLLLSIQPLLAHGTAFTYQGQLNSGAGPANGFYDFEFSLSNAPSGGSQIGATVTQLAIGVTNGLFTTTLNFGAVFTGNDTWLAISVRSNGVGSYTALTPPQELTPAPYAIYAPNAGSATSANSVASTNITGAIALAQLPAAVVTNNDPSVTLSNVTVSGNLTLPLLSDTTGIIYEGTNTLVHGDQNNNFYAGQNAGSLSNAGSANTGIGPQSLQSNTNGTNNTAIGYVSLGNNTNGSYNTAVGERALNDNTSGNDNTGNGRHALENNTNGKDNTAIGFEALSSLTSGSNNIALGSQASSNFVAGESSNIDLGNPGVSGDNKIIRLGSGQTNTFIAGVINGNGSGLTNLSAAQLGSGIIPLAQLPAAVVTNNDAASVTLSGTFSGNGAGLTNINVATLGGLSSAAFWKTNGNAGANPTNGAFLGTTDGNPLELDVDGTRGLRIEPDSRGDNVPTLIGGFSGNAVLQPNSGGDFIAGGGFASTPNLIYSNSSGVFIGAGSGNQVGPNVNDVVLAGGNGNAILAPDAAVGGGVNNSVAANAQFAVIGGGQNNTNTALAGTVGGGSFNLVRGTNSTVSGGFANRAIGNSYGFSTVSGGSGNTSGSYATVVGGYGNTAGGFGSFVGGGGFDGTLYIGNTAGGEASVVSGGLGNDASGDYATVAGGLQNVASGPGSFIGGGGTDGTNFYGNIASGPASTVGGGLDNTNTAYGGTVSGGEGNISSGQYSTVGGGGGSAVVLILGVGTAVESLGNQASGDFSTVGGGDENTASGDYSTVGGGGGPAVVAGANLVDNGNTASGIESTVGGGGENIASGDYSTVGGGGGPAVVIGTDVYDSGNAAGGTESTVGGGSGNIASGAYSTVGGGGNNRAIGQSSTVPGGNENYANGDYSFAAGNNAMAAYQGCFVWADSQNNPFFSTASNQVSFRCAGGVLFTSGSGGGNQTVAWTPGSASWSFSSDRNLKDRIVPVSAESVLEKVQALPLVEWSYKGYSQRHIGPMAQDFHALFPLNDNDKMLDDADLHGVALAAIQGLNQKLNEKDAEIQKLKEKVDKVDLLELRLNELERKLQLLAAQK